MKTLTIIMSMLMCASAVFAASVFDDKSIRQNNEQIRKSIERSNTQRELNGVESEMNRLRGSGKPSDMKDMRRYESRQQDLQRSLSK